MVHFVPDQLRIKVTIFVGFIHLVKVHLVVMVLANHTNFGSADWLRACQRPRSDFLAVLAVDHALNRHRDGFEGGSSGGGGGGGDVEEEEEKGEGEEVFG